jgi:hypothetical protein
MKLLIARLFVLTALIFPLVDSSAAIDFKRLEEFDSKYTDYSDRLVLSSVSEAENIISNMELLVNDAIREKLLSGNQSSLFLYQVTYFEYLRCLNHAEGEAAKHAFAKAKKLFDTAFLGDYASLTELQKEELMRLFFYKLNPELPVWCYFEVD